MRDAFYRSIDAFWPNMYGEPYALYDVHVLSQQQAAALRLATKRAGHIYEKVAHLLRHVDDATLAAMGYPKETWAFLRLARQSAQSVIARFDFIPYGDTYKCIELNADTPTFIKELFFVNGKVCASFQKDDVNAGYEAQLAAAVRRACHGHTVFTAHVDNAEDYYTARYLQSFVPNAHFTPLAHLHIRRGVGLFDDEQRKIDTLYRQTYPIEQLVAERNEAGEPIGQWLLELVALGELDIVNPPAAFLLQNKAVQAVIWGMHEEQHPFFTAEEHRWIAHYFLPSYLEKEPLQARGVPFVEKPVFGREGDTVSIYEASGMLLAAEAQRTYTKYPMLYQQYVKQPTVAFQLNGRQEGELMFGSFLLAGEPSAIGARVGQRITNNLSYFLPVAVQ